MHLAVASHADVLRASSAWEAHLAADPRRISTASPAQTQVRPLYCEVAKINVKLKFPTSRNVIERHLPNFLDKEVGTFKVSYFSFKCLT